MKDARFEVVVVVVVVAVVVVIKASRLVRAKGQCPIIMKMIMFSMSG